MLGLALSTTLYTYSGFGLKTKAAATEHFGDRSAEAGDTWFVAATESHPIFKYDHDMASDQLNAVVAENSAALAYDRAVGAFYFLLHYGRRDIATQFVDRKALTAFAGATEPIGLVMFGYAGLGLLMVGLASLWALLGVYLVSAVRNRSAVSAMFAAYLIASLFSGYVSGTLSVFVNRGFLKPGLVMLMIELAALGAAMAFRKGAGVRAPVAKTAAAKSPVAKPGPAVWRTGEARGRYSARSAR